MRNYAHASTQQSHDYNHSSNAQLARNKGVAQAQAQAQAQMQQRGVTQIAGNWAAR